MADTLQPVALAPLSKEMRQSLIKAGVGVKYHSMYLSELGTLGKQVIETLVGNEDKIKAGTGLRVVKRGASGYDLFMLIARALHIGNIRVRVIPLIRLYAAIKDAEKSEWLSEAHALCVLNFQQETQNPLRPYEVAEVEAYMDEQMASKRPVLTLWSAETAKANSWWTSDFIDRLNQNSKAIRG
jgi:hypothetical protein